MVQNNKDKFKDNVSVSIQVIAHNTVKMIQHNKATHHHDQSDNFLEIVCNLVFEENFHFLISGPCLSNSNNAKFVFEVLQMNYEMA